MNLGKLRKLKIVFGIFEQNFSRLFCHETKEKERIFLNKISVEMFFNFEVIDMQ